jgi:hypothetical protein
MILDKLHPILQRYRAPAGDADGGGGAADDRGDDFVSTDDDADDKVGDDKAGDAAKDDDKDKDDADDKEKDGDDDKDDAKDAKEAKADKDDKGTKKDNRVPLSRHKEILAKEREAREEAERKLAQYQGGDRVAATNERITKTEEKILGLDKEYTKLLTDGEHEKAAEKRREIRTLENEVIELKSDMKASVASAQAVEKMRYDITVERLEAAYPVLNPDHEEHDADAAQDVMDLASTYRARRGMTPSQAIQKAAEKLLGVATKKQEQPPPCRRAWTPTRRRRPRPRRRKPSAARAR